MKMAQLWTRKNIILLRFSFIQAKLSSMQILSANLKQHRGKKSWERDWFHASHDLGTRLYCSYGRVTGLAHFWDQSEHFCDQSKHFCEIEFSLYTHDFLYVAPRVSVCHVEHYSVELDTLHQHMTCQWNCNC